MACGFANGQTAYTTPVGYYNFNGVTGGNIFVPGIVNSASFAGQLVSATSTTLTVAAASLSANAFDAGAVYATHYVEITSGPNAGYVLDILSNTTAVITLADNISALGLTGTETITVRKHVTLKSCLAGADSLLSPYADSATFYATDGTTSSYFYGADGGTGWSSDFATADGDLRPIAPGSGFVLGLGSGVALPISGEVKSSATVVMLGAGVVNVVGPLNPLVGTSTPLNNTGLGSLAAYADGISLYVPGPLVDSTSYFPLGDGTISSDLSTPTTDTISNTTGVVVIPATDTALILNSGFTVAP